MHAKCIKFNWFCFSTRSNDDDEPSVLLSTLPPTNVNVHGTVASGGCFRIHLNYFAERNSKTFNGQTYYVRVNKHKMNADVADNSLLDM